MAELKPCEFERCFFCHHRTQLEVVMCKYHLDWHVRCRACGACGPAGETKQQAISAWNGRIINEETNS